MRQAARVLMIFALWACPALTRADEACDALGHLLLAGDLMRIAADASIDLNESYGPSIGASIRSSAELSPEFQRRAPAKVSALTRLRDFAAASFAVVSAGRADRSSLDAAGQGLAQDARQLYVDWTCDDPEPGPGNGDLEGGVDGERDPSSGGVGRGGGANFRAVWVAIGRENPIERAVLLGSFATSIILLPYLVFRDRRNRRREERHVCACPTSIIYADQRIAARFFDISASGARIILDEALRPGAEIQVEVAGEDRPARVARSGKGFAGLQFEDILSKEELYAQLDLAQEAMLFPAKKPA